MVVRISNLTKIKVIPNTIWFLSLVLEWFIVSIRNWTGAEDFVPVVSDAPEVVYAQNRPKENR
jgi:hypothetical protein